jgi:hypothetical protein
MNRFRALAGLAGVGLALVACSPGASQDPWPKGAVIAGRSAALAILLEQIQSLEGTPLAREASAVARRLSGCESIEGQDAAGDLGAAARSIDCASAAGAFSAVHAWRGQRDLAFAVPLESGGRIRGALSVSPAGDVDVEISLPPDAFGGAGRLLLPGTRPVGPGVLNGDERLVHLRLRPDAGIDLASLVPSDSQAAQLFRLKSGLFQGLVLDGTWEAALYVPEPGRPMPRSALALGFSSRRAAQIAMDTFLSEIEATWSLRRTPFSAAGASGSCLLDLRLLPDLAPCYVATDRALVIGWNAASVRKAVEGSPGEAGASAGVASAELALFADADARLSALAGGGLAAASIQWPWRRVVADGAREGKDVRIRLHLESGDGA